MTNDRKNAACGLLAGTVPVLDCVVLPVDRRYPSDPQDTRTIVTLSRTVVADVRAYPAPPAHEYTLNWQ